MVIFHLFIISTFPLAVPLEWNVLFVYATVFLFARLPGLGRLRGHGHVLAGLTVGDRGRAAVLPDPRQPAPGPGVVPALDAPVRGQLGVGDVGVRAGRRGQAEHGHPRPDRNQVDQLHRSSATTAAVAEITMQQTIALAHHAQPGPRPVLGAAEPPARTSTPATVREAEFACNSIDRVQLRRRAPAQRGPDRRGPEARSGSSPASSSWSGWSRRPVHAAPAVQGDRRRARRDRARHLEGGRRGRRAALAAQRPDPAAGHVGGGTRRRRCRP